VNRRLLVLVCAILALNMLGAGLTAAQSLPTVKIGFVHDRSSSDWATGFRDSLRLEIGRILEVDYTVEMPADLDITADGSSASVRGALEQLLGNPKVDLVVATGPLGSLEASRMGDLKHPVIGSWILDTEIQGVPIKDGTSGIHNYTYVTTGDILGADLAALDMMVDYEHLVLVGSDGWVAALPGDGSALARFTDGRTSFMVGSGTAESIMSQLPTDADAVYLLPMVDMSSVDLAGLMNAFIERKLPVLSLVGENEVRAGALVGVAPGSWMQRMYRRVALNAAQIMSGTPAADIPVMMMRDGRLFLNMQTAHRIGVSPPFEVILEAVMIGDISQASGEQIDIQGVMDEAQIRNHEIAAAERAVAAGEHMVNVSKGDLLPQAGVGLSGELVDEDLALAVPSLSEQTLNGQANFSQVLYSDRAWAGFTIEKHLQEARVGELNRVRLDVGLEDVTAYLDVLSAQTRLGVQRQNLAFSRTNLERAQVRVSVGDANRSELYRWESKIAGEQTLVMDAAINFRLANIQLNRVLDRPLEDDLNLFDSTVDDQYDAMIDPRVDKFTRDPINLEILRDFLVQQGLMGSPELQQFDALILASEREHTLSNRSFWAPDIELAGGLNHIFARGGEGGEDIGLGEPSDTSWNVGVFLSLPIFEGGSRFAETKRTTEETFRLQRSRQASAQRIEQDVRNAVFQAASSRLAIGLARKSAEAARLNLEIVADNYTVGQVSLVDLLDAQTNSLNTDLAAIDAVNNYLVDLMRVERAIGKFTFFVPQEEREAWIDALEGYAAQRP